MKEIDIKNKEKDAGDDMTFENVVIAATIMTAKTDWDVPGLTVKANLTFGVH